MKYEKVTLENSLDILEQLDDIYEEIPMENSNFQIRNFVINSSITPERAFRAIGLNLRDLLEQINGQYVSLLQSQDLVTKIEKEIEDNKNDDTITENEKLIKENELRQTKIALKFNRKLIRDLEEQANVYYAELKRFPRYNREQYEKAEARYYLEDLKRQAMGLEGAKGALLNMLDDTKCLENFKDEYAKLPDNQKHMLEELTQRTMKNMLPNEVDGRTRTSSQYLEQEIKNGENQ